MTFRMLLIAFASTAALAEDEWNQWRGPSRNGVSSSEAALLDALPEEGIVPLWVSAERIDGGGVGGWSSPVVAGGRLYCFVHGRRARKGIELPAEEYPPLTDAQREELSKDEVAEYERKRHDEQRKRRDRQFQYHEAIYCHDAGTGELFWTKERDSVATGFGQSGTPAVVKGRLYYLGADRVLICLDAEKGERLWAAPLPVAKSEEQVSSSVAVAEGVAAVLAGDLVGVDAESGEILWKSEKGRMTGMDSSPAVWTSGRRSHFVVNVNGNETVCVEPRTGKEVWRVASQAGRSTPVIVGDRMITLGDNRKNGLRCFSLSEESAEHRWTYPGICDPGASPVIVDGHVYVQGENRLACVDLDTGEAAWTQTLDLAQPRYTSLLAADGKVFYVFDSVLGFAADPEEYRMLMHGRIDKQGRLAPEEHFRRKLAIPKLESAEGGQEKAQRLWQQEIVQHGPLECTSPAIAEGRLYIRRRSNLVCYDISRTPAVARKAGESRGSGSPEDLSE